MLRSFLLFLLVSATVLLLASCAEEEATSNIYYKDVLDGGDDPFNPGCEEVFTANTCPAPGRIARGDYCIDLTNLFEGTDQTCHQGDVGKTYDCDAECKKKGHLAGTCGGIPAMCGGLGSASCVCHDAAEKIAWASDRDGSYDIYIMNDDGTNIEQLTTGQVSEVNHHPVMTVGRSEIIWAQDRNLKMMDADGSNKRDIPLSGPADHPWAGRDGRVYFTRSVSGIHTIWSANLDGTDEQQHTPTTRESFHASLHPAEDLVIYTASAPGIMEGEEIRILDLQSGDDNELYRPGPPVSAATWQYPDGDRFIVAEKRAGKYSILSVMYPSGDVEVLVQNQQDNIVPYYYLPSGDGFVFTAVPGDRRTRELMKADADGSNLMNLTKHPAEDLIIAGYPDSPEPVTGPCRRPPVGCNPVPPPCIFDLPEDVAAAAELVGEFALARDKAAGVSKEIASGEFDAFAMAVLEEYLGASDGAAKESATLVMEYLTGTQSPELRNGVIDALVNSYLTE